MGSSPGRTSGLTTASVTVGFGSTSWLMTGGDVDVEAIRRSGSVNGKIVDEFMATGATVAGRGTFEPAGGWGGDHHDGVPIFILSRHEPPAEFAQMPLVTVRERRNDCDDSGQGGCG